MSTLPLSKIMLVEDEADIRKIVEIALKNVGGFEVALCESGALAVDIATTFNPDLILLDAMMPEMDGPATLKALRANDNTKNIPIMFITAILAQQEREAFKAMGAIEVIAKPFDPMTLASQVRTLWNQNL
ncbi:MAG: hypothetical protein COA42_21825 [Alteromonadaceae bacterium]|nr:MAG: hypothetical protein COA42_21825 [Alteromonadaceae bacterium]